MPQPESPGWRRAVFRLAGALGAALLTLLAVEVGLRALRLKPPGAFSNMRYVNDPLTGPQPLPSQRVFMESSCFSTQNIRINRWGMRGSPQPPAAAALRVALLGDSLIEGLQVSDAQVVSQQLQQALGSGVEVLNFGVSGTGTAIQWLQYRSRARAFHPDVVLVVAWLENDLLDNHPFLKQQRDPYMASVVPYVRLDAAGRLQDELQPGRPRTTPGWLGKVSAYAAGRWALHGWRSLRLRTAHPMSQAAAEAAAQSAPMQQAWSILEQVLQRLAADVAADGARFGLVVVPADLERLAEADDPSAGMQETMRLTQMAESLGVPVLDMGGVFRQWMAAHGPSSFVIPCDGHWNALGHAVAAQAMAHFLRAHSWIS